VIGKFGSTLEATKRKERTKLKFRMFQKIVTTFKTIRLRIRIVNRFNSIINNQLVVLKKIVLVLIFDSQQFLIQLCFCFFSFWFCAC
jgi:hypothetical protein